MDDWDLLEQFQRERSQQAFAQLVQRHAGLVYGVCRRRLGNAHLAEDVTQAVFVLLARRPPKRRGNSALPGWLYQTAVYACMNAMRSERIRARHEREFAERQPAVELPREWSCETDSAALDEALSGLSVRDRDALLLRYYQDKSVREVGVELGLSEDAASKRITRAVERLRARMQADVSPAVLGGMIAQVTQCTAPSGLAASVVAAGTTPVIASGVVGQVVEGVLLMNKIAQIKLAGIVAGIVLLGGGGVATVTTMLMTTPPASQSALAQAAPGGGSKPKPSADDLNRARELKRQGQVFWQQQRFEEAAEKFQQSIDIVATDADTWNGLGWARFNTGDPDAAKAAFERCVEINAAHLGGLNGLGQVAFSRGQFDEARKQFLKCADRASAAAYGLARIYLLEGNWADAENWITKCMKLEQGAEDDIYKRMLAAAKEKNLDDDLRALLAPPAASDASQQVMRGFALMQQGKMDEARELFDDALAQAPEDPDVLNGVGWYKFNTGQSAEAESLFEQALAKSPSHAAAMNGLAQCYRQQGKIDEAIALWEKMLKAAPYANAGMYSLAQVYLERGEFEKALPLWEKLAKQMPQNEQIQASLAAAREGAKK